LIEEIRSAIASARGIVILTGAGVSAESGIPTFREAGGLWARYRPEDLATPQGFARDPRRVWEWYEMRRRAVLARAPNPGHMAIARFLRGRDDVTVLTQNVDGLHHRAVTGVDEEGPFPLDGSSARARILELHGNLLRSRCSGCEVAPASERPDHPAPLDVDSLESLPRCEACGALLRPDVVWFGEPLNEELLDRAFAVARAAELCLVVGTSAVVHPAAGLPLATSETGGSLCEVNTEVTPLTSMCTWSLRGRSAGLLPQILANAGPSR
jgi:NAD-dependent deacetylase